MSLSTSAQLDELLEGVKNMKIQIPVNGKFFARLNEKHNKYMVKQDHVVASPIYEGIERKSLKIIGYEGIIHRYAASQGKNENHQHALFVALQLLERNLQLIDADEQEKGESVVYIYLNALATQKMLQYLDIMTQKGSNLEENERDMLLGLAKYYYNAFEDKRAQYEEEQEPEQESTEPINSNNNNNQ